VRLLATGSDHDVLSDGVVAGRIIEAAASLEGAPLTWTLAFGQHKDRTTHGYEPTRVAAMAAQGA
jgi:hypothetical protein